MIPLNIKSIASKCKHIQMIVCIWIIHFGLHQAKKQCQFQSAVQAWRDYWRAKWVSNNGRESPWGTGWGSMQGLEIVTYTGGICREQYKISCPGTLNTWRCVALLLKRKGKLTFRPEILNAASLYCPSKTGPLVYICWYSYYSIELADFHSVTQFI